MAALLTQWRLASLCSACLTSSDRGCLQWFMRSLHSVMLGDCHLGASVQIICVYICGHAYGWGPIGWLYPT